jgi:hypothetical protein
MICVTALMAVPAASSGRVATGGGSPEASGHVAKRCGTISSGKYRVRARATSCRFARRWSRAYLRSAARPSGYACSRPGHGIRLYCRKGARQYWAEEL